MGRMAICSDSHAFGSGKSSEPIFDSWRFTRTVAWTARTSRFDRPTGEPPWWFSFPVGDSIWRRFKGNHLPHQARGRSFVEGSC